MSQSSEIFSASIFVLVWPTCATIPRCLLLQKSFLHYNLHTTLIIVPFTSKIVPNNLNFCTVVHNRTVWSPLKFVLDVRYEAVQITIVWFCLGKCDLVLEFVFMFSLKFFKGFSSLFSYYSLLLHKPHLEKWIMNSHNAFP